MFCLLLLLYHNKGEYNFVCGNSYQVVSGEGKLLPENIEVKRYYLMAVGLAGWRKMELLIRKWSGSGGFLTHYGKNVTHFKINYDLSLPFKMSAIKINDEQSMVSYYLGLRKEKEKIFDLINDDFVDFLIEVDKKIISDFQVNEAVKKVNEFEEFTGELFKTMSPIFESFWKQQRRQFAEIEKLREYTNFVNKEIGVVKQDISEIKSCIEKINERMGILEELPEEGNDFETKSKKETKKRKEKVKDRIPKSDNYPFLAVMAEKHLLHLPKSK